MDIGIQEILLISVIALIVLGPERLPGTVKTIAIWLGRLKRSFNDIKADIEREINAEEIRQQIHNESVLEQLGEPIEQLQESERRFKEDIDKIGEQLSDTPSSAGPDKPAGHS